MVREPETTKNSNDEYKGPYDPQAWPAYAGISVLCLAIAVGFLVISKEGLVILLPESFTDKMIHLLIPKPELNLFGSVNYLYVAQFAALGNATSIIVFSLFLLTINDPRPIYAREFHRSQKKYNIGLIIIFIAVTLMDIDIIYSTTGAYHPGGYKLVMVALTAGPSIAAIALFGIIINIKLMMSGRPNQT